MGPGMQKATALVLVGALVLYAAVTALTSGNPVVAVSVLALVGGLVGWAIFRDKGSMS